MKLTLSRLRIFLYCFLVWFVGLIILRLNFSKGVLELSWNQEHNSAFDFFFFYFTWVGSGLVYGVFVLSMILFGKKKFYTALLASIICLLISLIMKNIFFAGEQRPLTFFGDTVPVYVPEGVPLLLYGSFPSGHTMSAFSMFTLAAFFFEGRGKQIIFFIAAVLVGVSRVYLMAHFIEDVIIGSLLGFVISVLSFNAMEVFFPKNHLPQNKF